MGDDRGSVYVEDLQVEDGDLRTMAVYRASSLGKCFRGLVASRLAMEPQDNPDWLKKRVAEGHAAEPTILKWAEANEHYGHTIRLLNPKDDTSYAGLREMVRRQTEHDGQFAMEMMVGNNAMIRGHLDGIGQVYVHDVGSEWENGQKLVVEAKKFGPSYMKLWERHGIEAFPYYMTQLTLYMEGTGLPALFVIGESERDEAGDVEIVRYHTTPFYHPPGNLAEYKMRVMKAERQAGTGMLPECDMKDYPCQWYWTGGKCAEEKVGEDGEVKKKAEWYEVGGDTAQEFYRQITNLNAAKVKIEKGEKEKSEANLKLAQLMVEAGPGYEGYVVAHTPEGGQFQGLVSREEPIGNFRLPDGTIVKDTAYQNKGGVRDVKPYWVRYPKVEKP